MPGLSIDCKSVANKYDIPLIAVTGRTSMGLCCIFGMGFIATQCEADVTWFLTQLKETMPADPNTITSDQDMATINACRKVFPRSYHMLDEWHLNMNQIKNVTAFLQASGKVALYERMKQESDGLPRTVGETAGAADTSPFDQMSTDLFTLRRSSTPERYAQRRAEFEMIYFETNDPRELPEWFRGLYVYKKEMIAECFNKTRCGLRFLFQGSGYTEAVNSLFRNVVMQRGVPMSRVPAELSRVTERYVRERGYQRDSVSRVLFARIEATGAFARGAQLDRFMHTFTSFAIKLWYDRSMIPSREWRVAGFMLMPVLVQALTVHHRAPPTVGAWISWSNRLLLRGLRNIR